MSNFPPESRPVDPNYAGAPPAGGYYQQPTTHIPQRRAGFLDEEAKSDLRSVEFIVFVVTAIAVIIASAVVATQHNRGDYFRADLAWILVTVLAVGFMIARGIAKSHRHHDHH